MRRVLVPTAVFAVILLIGYLLLSDAPVGDSLRKTLVVAAVYAAFRWWMVRRAGRVPGPEKEVGPDES